MKLPAAALLGAQRPRLHSVPAYTTSAGVEAIDLAASAGVYLDDWQELVLLDSLAERPGGTWAAFEVGFVVPRQNGKGEDLLVRELAGLYLFDERLIIHTAHEFKTASEAFRRVKNVIDGCDDLRRKVRAIREANGEQGIELLNGNRLRFLARSKGSGRGFTGDLVILDEAYALSAAMVGALIPTMSARPNPQLWYASSAGHPDSEVLHSVRVRALDNIAQRTPKRLAYLEWSAPDDAANDDRAAWALGNPALGIRISDEFVEQELEIASASPELLAEFRRERLGIWEDDAVLAVIAADVWAGLARPRATLADPVAFGIDMTPDRSRTSIGAADGELVEVVDSEPGSRWVINRVLELDRKHRPVAWVLDAGSPAGSLLPELARVGIEVLSPTPREVAGACGAFYDAAVANPAELRHIGQAVLTDAVAGTRKRELGDAWAWARKGDTDISPLYAVTFARWGWQAKYGNADVAGSVW